MLRLSMHVLLTVALVLFGLEGTALACKCAPHSVSQALAEASTVFEGRVVSIEDVSEGAEPAITKKKVTLSIVRVWKDLEDVETVTLTTNSESAACGFYFERDKSYLVYANRTDGALTTHSCTRTRPMVDAGEDLAQLGGGVTPVRITPAVKAADAGASAAKPTQPRGKGGCAVSVSPAGRSGFLALAVVGLATKLMRRRRKRGD